ncbi:phage tail tape measure protein [Mesorhizobium sp. B2-5-9]|nr:phage tail tape measure protein [Mesorhizobium sp. B2-5-9]
MGGFAGRLLAFGAGYIGVTKGIEGTIGAARTMQAALTEIGIKAGSTGAELEAMRGRVMALSPQVNQSTSELLAGVDAMVSLGLGSKDALAALPAIGRAATATGATIADLSAASVSAMQNLKVAPGEITAMLDAMASAGNAGAFELRDMAQYFPALGAAYQGLGQHGVAAVTDLAAAMQIVRKGTGDSASAATNLQNVLQKVNAPQTRKAFKKMGVDLTREMSKAAKRGLTPIEAIAEITNKTLKGDLSKLGDLFSDAQVQQGLRPLIQNMEEYRKIRDEASHATGTIAGAFASRMANADEKLKAFQLRMTNLGASIGARLIGPLGEAADYLTKVFDSLGERAGVFDKLTAAAQGFIKGFGVDGGIREVLDNLTDLLFGKVDGSGAADQLGAVFMRFQGWGADIRALGDAINASPIAKFFVELGGQGVKLMLASVGIGILAGAIGGLAKALYLLSGAKAAVSILKMLGRGGKWAANAASILSGAEQIDVGLPGNRPGASPKPSIPKWISDGRATNATTTGALVAATFKSATAWAARAAVAVATSPVVLAAAAAAVTAGALINTRPADPSLNDPRRAPEKGNEYRLRMQNNSPTDPGILHELYKQLPQAAPKTEPVPFSFGQMLQDLMAPIGKPAGGDVAIRTMPPITGTVTTQPSGVQQVTVTNPVRPNVSVSVTVHATTNASPAEIGSAVGAKVRSAVEGTFGDVYGGM